MSSEPGSHSSQVASVGGPEPAPKQTPPPGDALDGAGRGVGSAAGSVARRFLDQEAIGVLAALVVVVVVTTIFHPEFFTYDQLIDTVRQSVYIGIIASGMAFLIAMRELDLSVGSIYGLSAMIGGLLMQNHGVNPWVAAAVCILAGAICGLANGLAVQVIGISSIIATLATLSVFRGLDYALAKGTQVANLPIDHPFFSVFGGDVWRVPVSVIVLVGTTIGLTLLLRLTPFGYRVRAIGSNPEAAAFSGISIPRVRLQALILMGALAGLTGAMSLAFFVTADPNQGVGFELQAIAAAVIGGNALRGGVGTVFGAVLGALLLGLVSTSLIYFGVPLDWSAFATGVTILAAVSVDALVRRVRDAIRE